MALPMNFKKSMIAQSRQQPGSLSQSKMLAGMDTDFYDLDINSDQPLEVPSSSCDSQPNVIKDKNSSRADVISLPPQLHIDEHHQHHLHRHGNMTIDDMSEQPSSSTSSTVSEMNNSHSRGPEGSKPFDHVKFVSQGGGVLSRKGMASKLSSTVVDIGTGHSSSSSSSSAPTTTCGSSTTYPPTVAGDNIPSYSASFFSGWFDLPPSLSGQPPSQRPRLSMSMQGSVIPSSSSSSAALPPPPLAMPSSSSLPNTLVVGRPAHETIVDIPLGPMGPLKKKAEGYDHDGGEDASHHQKTFSIGDTVDDDEMDNGIREIDLADATSTEMDMGVSFSKNVQQESRRGQMAQ
ncbi:hypothetical protein BG004_004537 [Podila humilis]|nr:hypothetical protein BG004_004537 [Podila humilis]